MTDYERGYRQGYADAMNWKTQNHLEHLPGRQELVIDCPRCGHCCPQRPWVGLTVEEVLEEEEFINHRYGKHINQTTAILLDFVRQLETKLKEKNGG